MGSRAFAFLRETGYLSGMTDISPLLRRPNFGASGTVFSVPHSGRAYSAAFLKGSDLDLTQIRSSEDAYVDELFDSATDFGASMVIARAPRAYVDLNRSSGDLDPALVRGVRVRGQNPRVSSGLGVIPRVVAQGRPIRRGKMSLAEAEARLRVAYFPYHEMLQNAVDLALDTYGQALLIDCHSMPREAVVNLRAANGRVPDIVLGDRYGASCGAGWMDAVEGIFTRHGFAVLRNTPFAGVDILRRYGRPFKGQHAIQVEVNRGLYLDERRVEKTDGFEILRQRLSDVVADLADLGRQQIPLAAE